MEEKPQVLSEGERCFVCEKVVPKAEQIDIGAGYIACSRDHQQKAAKG